MLAIYLQKGLDPELVGAKSANLGRAIDIGLSVPAGAIITRRALRLFLEEAGLLEMAQRVIDTPDCDPERVGAYKALCEHVLASPIPPGVVEAVTPISETLLAQASYGLAVRSSGVHEDSTMASFAGVYDSFLGLRSEEDIWMAVRRCWCGSWAPQAIDYARKMGVMIDLDGMAVLLQTLVNANSAGVLFTADPLTGNPWRFVLESSFGLARDLVASTGVTPVDRFLLQWDSGEITARKISSKKTALVPTAGGINTIDLPPDRQAVPSLSDDLATRIAQVGLEIDRAFGVRVDVEWAVEGEGLHIVQVRPITALPEFFPYHLPAGLADRTWLTVANTWHGITKPGETVTLPIHRHRLITENFNRYLDVGPLETPAHRKCGAELDIHGHRYYIKDDDIWPPWPRIPISQHEAYLVEYEPRMRTEFLHTNNTRFNSIEQKARHLEKEAKTPAQAVDAILWAQDEIWDIWAILSGPSQHLSHTCRGLLTAFVDEHLPEVDINDLLQGHHPELDPYWPHVLMADAEEMATLLEPERKRFQHTSVETLIEWLEAGEAPALFIAALQGCCDRLGLVPPWQFHILGDAPHERWARRQTKDLLRLIRSALRGAQPIARIVEETTRLCKAAMVRARGIFAPSSVELTRFERLHDWALFWGPTLNHRVHRADVPAAKLRRLVRRMQQVLLVAGWVDDVDDVLLFTVEDLKVIAVTGDIAAGRRLLQTRKLDFERSDRLVAPAFLGNAPEEGPPARTDAAPAADGAVAEPGLVITGRPAGPGRHKGVVRRIETLAEGDDVGGEEDVMVLLNAVQSNNNDVLLLFSMMLRVRGLVVPDAPGMMWTGHMSQIARECRVPIVQVVPSDLDRLVDGCLIDVDGSRGTVTLLDPV